jgi:type VI secretion system protein VasD
MTLRTRRAVVASVLAAGLAMAACKSGAPTKPVAARLTLTATADINPDSSGRPSPVVIRVYQLKGDAKFNAADFFAIYDDAQKALGPEMISFDEFVMTPAERRPVELKVAPDARFVGVVAAYRDIRNAQWRIIVPTPLKKDATISVEKARVQLTFVD